MKFSFYTCIMLVIMVSSLRAQSNYAGAGISLSFDGSAGNYVDLGDVFNTIAFPIAIQAWVNPDAYSSTNAAIFSLENDQLNAAGFWLSLTPTGQVQIEFGDGTGSGTEHTRGYVSVGSVPLNKWSQISVVCRKATDVTIYIAGIMQEKITTSGTSTSILLTHSAASASIGSHVDAAGENWFNGQIDEVRLWNINRNVKDVRDNLCSKLNYSSTGLIGYWTADESYTEPTLQDHTASAANGNILGIIGKNTSTAPLGDVVRYTYTNNWFEIKVTLKAPTGDMMMTQDITGDGIYIYRVDAPPYTADGLINSPGYYYGVFMIDLNTPASYNVRYKYSTNNGVVTNDNESIVELMSRDDATQSWSDVDGIIDLNKNWITKHDGIHYRGEYTINVPQGEKQAVPDPAAAERLDIYPNPAGNAIHLHLSDASKQIIAVRILNAAGTVIQEIKETNQQCEMKVDVSNLANGIYIADVITTAGHLSQRFMVQK